MGIALFVVFTLLVLALLVGAGGTRVVSRRRTVVVDEPVTTRRTVVREVPTTTVREVTSTTRVVEDDRL